MDFNTKYGRLNELKAKCYVIGPRNAWDTTLIGPFKTAAEAYDWMPEWMKENYKHCICERNVHGQEALKVLEQLEGK